MNFSVLINPHRFKAACPPEGGLESAIDHEIHCPARMQDGPGKKEGRKANSKLKLSAGAFLLFW